jgi:hypothetical protein
MMGPACQTQWPLKWRPIAGLMHVRQLLSHAPADRALPRTSATCAHAAPCTLIHYVWLQWTTSTTLRLLLTPSHRPHSSATEVRLAVTDHRLAATDHRLASTDHRRAPSMPPQRPPVSRPSSRAAIRRPPPQDVALTALFHCLCFASAEHATPVRSSIRRFSLRFTVAAAPSYPLHPSSLHRSTRRSSEPPPSLCSARPNTLHQ